MHAATATEWAAAVGFGTGASATVAALFFLTVDADRADFDPRRLLDTDLGARLLDAIVNARLTTRDALLTVAALLMLLTAAPEATP